MIMVGTFVNDIALFPVVGNVMVNVLLKQEVVPAHRFAPTCPNGPSWFLLLVTSLVP